MDSIPLDTTPGKALPLPEANGRKPVHVFDRESVLAVNTALACGRPLLVRGEPGTGKSQLALAVAMVLNRVPKSRVVDARTEPHELMWTYDAVGRLADAQAYGALLAQPNAKVERPDLKCYIHPGSLWWAFNWTSAETQESHSRKHADDQRTDEKPEPWSEGMSPRNGVVLLIDEIDKADMAVPNALLECLGSGRFDVPSIGCVKMAGPEPLVMLTTNTDRVLPNAFVRRCVVLHMRVPTDRDELIGWLTKRGEKHFEKLDAGLRAQAAVKVAEDRLKATTARIHCPPGLAEYIDLLAALERNPELKLDQIARFVLDKHKDPGRPDYGE